MRTILLSAQSWTRHDTAGLAEWMGADTGRRVARDEHRKLGESSRDGPAWPFRHPMSAPQLMSLRVAGIAAGVFLSRPRF